MANWRVEFSSGAERDFAALDTTTQKRIVETITWFSENFDEIIPLPLGGDWRGFFKLRVGDWRIIYQILHQDRILLVYYIDRRDKIYKR